MGGWIKLEKDLLTDPRVLRMASRFCHGDVTRLNDARLMMIGALATLWAFADTHIRDDDILECSVDEINQVIGVANFCDLIPSNWLQILDTDKVHLPDFLAHNGVDAKRRASDAKRQSKYRANCHGDVTVDRNVNRDQTKTKTYIRKRQGDGVVFDVESVAGLDREAWNRWVAYRSAMHKPLKPVSMREAAESMAKLGPRQLDAVKQSIANGWQGLFEPKAATNGHAKPAAAPVDLAPVWAELNARRQAMNPPFRGALPAETTESYRTALMLEEMRRHGSNGAARHDG
jgi:hypothetical protein